MVFLTKTFTLTATDKGLLVAISFVGTALGLVLFGDIADRVGRKKVFAFNLWSSSSPPSAPRSSPRCGCCG